MPDYIKLAVDNTNNGPALPELSRGYKWVVGIDNEYQLRIQIKHFHTGVGVASKVVEDVETWMDPDEIAREIVRVAHSIMDTLWHESNPDVKEKSRAVIRILFPPKDSAVTEGMPEVPENG